MSNSNYDLDLESEKNRTMNMAENEQNAWLTSYSDIVTLLLCFFIIFYAIEKGIEKNKVKDVIADLKKEMSGQGGTENQVQKGFPYFLGPEAVEKIESLKKIKDVKLLKHNDYISILFEDSQFFRFSSSILLDPGKNILKPILNKLKPIEDSINIVVVGHTDPVKFSKKSRKAWWANNMELSVARSLRVRDYIREYGFSDQGIFVMGTGPFFSNASQADWDKLTPELMQEISKNRKISLRIEARAPEELKK